MGFIKKLGEMFRSDVNTAPEAKPGRNDACWCGSGKKYKKCHLIEDDLRQCNKVYSNCGTQ